MRGGSRRVVDRGYGLTFVLTLAQARNMGLDKKIDLSDLPKSSRGRSPRRAKAWIPTEGDNAVLTAIARQSPPQALLTEKAVKAFPDVAIEYTPLAGSAIRVDLAFPALQLAVEVNGWSNHGKTLKAFQNDHVRTRKLMMAGWVILPFTAGEVLEDCAGCIRQIAEMKRLIQSVW